MALYPTEAFRIDRECFAGSQPSARTLHAELLRLCARIGYSPPSSV
ncbi:hypothetical protein [Mesorhizobium sp. NBSH29]|nr:hypothetical protein [Mesorhizobium sp. NBSH29]